MQLSSAEQKTKKKIFFLLKRNKVSETPRENVWTYLSRQATPTPPKYTLGGVLSNMYENYNFTAMNTRSRTIDKYQIP